MADYYDLCLKLSEVTDIYHLAKPLYYYRRHSGNVTNQQVEVIQSAHQAITNALQRRGLNHHYQLTVTPTFSLRPKPHVSELPSPPIQPLTPTALNPLISICKFSRTSAGDSHLTSAGDSHKVRHLILT